MQKNKEKRLLILVTGMSGAGRSTSLRVLEDLGFETIDNLPLALLSPFLEQYTSLHKPIAVGLNARMPDLSIADLQSLLGEIAIQGTWTPHLLYLECQDEVLLRRYMTSRRRHPLEEASLQESLLRERQIIAPLKAIATSVIDTSIITPHQLTRLLQQYFTDGVTSSQLVIEVISFSYRKGIPPEADLIFDTRFLTNPFYEDELRDKTGCDTAVATRLLAHPYWIEAERLIQGLISLSLKGFRENGRTYVTIAFGCTGGQHRSVFVAEQIVTWLKSCGEEVNKVLHREL